ncbi:MAG: crossover junction endodeoxyribonuclease RuvC [Candidatus Gastranaerophilales bacterium]|nr:crossover junction endodeoxyribonuclease RuvC [Candidatus Gastranaerophilales bacterium]
MRIIGIDPGTAIVGYCILDVKSSNRDDEYQVVDSGSIQTDKKEDQSHRLLEIYNDLKWILEKFKPDVGAVEQIFFFKNAKTIIPVCEARGVIIMTLKMFNISSYEYTPLVVKQTITGYGRADKDEVKEMVRSILNVDTLPKLDDAVDAIAIALCHARQQEHLNKI